MNCPWEAAIQQAATLDDVHQGADYLSQLSNALQGPVANAPTLPVPFLPPRVPQDANNGQRNNRNGGRNNRNNNNNRFGAVAPDDDEEQAGNPQLQPQPNAPQGSVWSAEDIFIQVKCALGEILCKIALIKVKERKWMDCGNLFTQSYNLLNFALEMADTMYARITARAELGDYELGVVVDRVRRNCAAVSIAAGHGGDKKTEFEQLATKRKEQLQRNLSPQWEDRDAARASMGEDAWMNNPRPKRDYAKMREADERELRELERAQVAVAAVDYHAVRERSEHLRRVA